MSYFCQDEERMRRNTIGHNSLNSLLIWQITRLIFCSHFLFVCELYLSPSPLCLKRLEVLFCCCVVLFCLFSVGNFLSQSGTPKSERWGMFAGEQFIYLFIFCMGSEMRRQRALFLENTNVIRDARDLKIPPFLMITFNMHRKSFFTDSGRLSTE